MRDRWASCCWLWFVGLCGWLLTAGCYAEDELLVESETQARKPAPVVVGYLPSHRLERPRFDAERLGPVTDLVYFSVEVTQAGAIPLDTVDAESAERFVAPKEAADCRLLLCVGGWGRSEHFPAVAGDQDKRRALIESLLKLCERHGFDGVDYDWEHPKDKEQLDAYATLIEETAAVFRPKGLLVTVAQAGWQDLGKHAYKALDRVHLMCYDQPFPHATMEHAREEVARLIDWGCPPEKIALGVPFYGRNKERKARSYAALVRGASGWDPALDSIDGYAFNGPDTIEAKTRFAIESGLAGVMIWELSHDLPGERSLLGAVARGLERKQANE